MSAVMDDCRRPSVTLGYVLLLVVTAFSLAQALAFALVLRRSSQLDRQTSTERRDQEAVGIAMVENNAALLKRLGLAPLSTAEETGTPPERPKWLADALDARLLVLQARVVDFWAHEPSNKLWCQLRWYLEYLGFEVVVDTECEQIENACGYVAARSIVTMKNSADGTARGDAWRTCDLSDAADPRWVKEGNNLLTNPLVVPRDGMPIVHSQAKGAMLAPWHVQTMVRCFARKEFGLDVNGEVDTFDQQQSAWMPDVSSRDAIVVSIVRDLYKAVTGGGGDSSRSGGGRSGGGGGGSSSGNGGGQPGEGVPLKFFVCNSHDSSSILGRHWATVALQIEPTGRQLPQIATEGTTALPPMDLEDAA